MTLLRKVSTSGEPSGLSLTVVAAARVISASMSDRTAAMADCTSWAAASTSRSSENWSVICVEPSVLVDVMLSMPAIAENAFSSWAATVAAIVSGLAPDRLALTFIVG